MRRLIAFPRRRRLLRARDDGLVALLQRTHGFCEGVLACSSEAAWDPAARERLTTALAGRDGVVVARDGSDPAPGHEGVVVRVDEDTVELSVQLSDGRTVSRNIERRAARDAGRTTF